MELGATVCTPKSPKCPGCPVQSNCAAYALSKRTATAVSPLKRQRTSTEPQPDPDVIVIDSSSDSEPESVELSGGCDICDIEALGAPLSACSFPLKTVKKTVPVENLAAAVILAVNPSGEPVVLMSKRPSTGILAGHWEPVNVIVGSTAPKAEETDSDSSCTGVKTDMKSTNDDVDALFDKLQSSVGVDIAKRKLLAAGTVNHVFSHVHHVRVALNVPPLVNVYLETVCVDVSQNIAVFAAVASSDVSLASADSSWIRVAALPDCGLSTWACKILRVGIQKVLSSFGLDLPEAAVKYVTKRAGSKSDAAKPLATATPKATKSLVSYFAPSTP
jgi:adenine-specific DNA glycosylase